MSNNTTTDPTMTPSPAPPVPKPASDDAEAYVNLTVDGGVRKKVVKQGDGIDVVDGSLVTVHYSGYLYPDGPIFDSSRTRGNPFQFKIGKGIPLTMLRTSVLSWSRTVITLHFASAT
jgi:hypothetical protein